MLRENNKYLCAECSRLNEAQRSVQYELLPKILVLQLKRFTAASNKSAFMSKINDFIPTPFTMNCFCTQCMPTDMPPQPPGEASPPPPKHHYRLFAVIMHLGATLASGHYIAYVRASIDLTNDYSQCPRATQISNVGSDRQKSGSGGSNGGNGNSSSGNGKKGIMKYFSRSSDSKNGASTKVRKWGFQRRKWQFIKRKRKEGHHEVFQPVIGLQERSLNKSPEVGVPTAEMAIHQAETERRAS